ncbi:MAG: type II secretion system protein [Nitrospirae bacterium]|nr:type II secretion system protein [Nitrospirota bacterium]
MKQKIKKSFFLSIHRFTASPLYRKEGFTLIEIAMVLIIVGLLLTMGIALFGTLTKRAKHIESREAVKQAKEAVLGYAVKNGFVPCDQCSASHPNAACQPPTCDAATYEALGTAGARKQDSWTRDIVYYASDEIEGSGKNACGVNTTTMQVYECTNATCTTYLTKSNIAFIVYSKGEDANGTGTGTASPFRVREQASSYTDGATYEYDDIVQYVSLDEIRSLRGCPQPLAVTSPATLAEGEEDSYYSQSLEAIGGKPPYTWATWSGYGLSLSSSGLISGTINYKGDTSTGDLTQACSSLPSISVSTSVTDSAGSTAVAYSGSITVKPKQLKIVTETLPAAYEGSYYSATISGTAGKTPYSWSMSVSPSCPAGLTCSGNTITGTPNTGTAGTYTVTITANSSETGLCTATKVLSLTVNAATSDSPTALSCTLTASPNSILQGQTANLLWTVKNGPATTAAFSPNSGTCASFPGTSGGSCTTAALTTTTTFTLTVTKGSESNTCMATVYVNPTLAPSCTLEATPNPVSIGNPTTLIWSISNGPANGTWSGLPTGGTCGSFSNSYGGNCQTGNITANTTVQLSVSNGYGSGLCATTVYTTSQDSCSAITVRNATGASIYVKGGQYGTTCRRIRDNRTFNVNYSDTSAVTLWQNSTCTSNPQDIKSVSYSSSIPADAYAASTDADRDCTVAIDEVATNDWELVDE